MTFKIYNVECDGCSDTEITEFGNKFHIEMIKKSLRKIELECENLMIKNQSEFGDSNELTNKSLDLMQQLFDEIKVEGI